MSALVVRRHALPQSNPSDPLVWWKTVEACTFLRGKALIVNLKASLNHTEASEVSLKPPRDRSPVDGYTQQRHRFARQRTRDEVLLEAKQSLDVERTRADRIDERRCVAELRNELLTEMVAAEQVT